MNKFSAVNKHKLKGRYVLANLTLGFMGIGLLASFPFRTKFSGGLAFSIFSAGTIAGLADWFAVTALFRRPLGIRPGRILRTEIIARNRERIFQSLTEMVDKLLSKETVLEKLRQFHVGKFLVDYLSEPQVLKELTSVGQNLLDAVDTRALLQDLASLGEQLLEEESTGPYLVDLFKGILSKSREQDFDLRAVSYILHHLQSLSAQPEVFNALEQIVRDAYHTYEADHAARKWIDVLLPSPAEMAWEIQKAIVAFLSGPEPVSLARAWIDARLQEEPAVLLSFWINLAKTLHLKDGLSQPGIVFLLRKGLQQSLVSQGIDLVCSLQEQPERLQALDQFLKSSLSRLIDRYHPALNQIIRSKLDTLTGEDLAKLIELKAGNDLQMIRINGSVIGGLAGMFIYLLTTLF